MPAANENPGVKFEIFAPLLKANPGLVNVWAHIHSWLANEGPNSLASSAVLEFSRRFCSRFSPQPKPISLMLFMHSPMSQVCSSFYLYLVYWLDNDMGSTYRNPRSL
jgi:hypothetical protein